MYFQNIEHLAVVLIFVFQHEEDTFFVCVFLPHFFGAMTYKTLSPLFCFLH